MGTPPGVRRDDDAPAGERLQHRGRHIVDVRRLQVDVGVRVVAPHFRGRNRTDETHIPQPPRGNLLTQQLCLRSGADQRQRGFGKPPLDDLERSQRAGHVVERLEVTRAEQPGAEIVAPAKREALQIDDVGDDLRANVKSREYLLQERRWHRIGVDPAQHRPGNPRALQMIRGLATAVVEHDWLSQQASNQDGRRRCKKKREI